MSLKMSHKISKNVPKYVPKKCPKKCPKNVKKNVKKNVQKIDLPPPKLDYVILNCSLTSPKMRKRVQNTKSFRKTYLISHFI